MNHDPAPVTNIEPTIVPESTQYLNTLTVRNIGTTGITNASSDDMPGSALTAKSIAIGGSSTGTIEYIGDTDWIQVELTKGTLYRFDLVLRSGFMDAYLNLYDSSGKLVGFDDDSGDASEAQLTYLALTSGVYYLDSEGT